MNYPDEINYIIKEEMTSLIEMKKASVFPFNKETIEHYSEVFKQLRSKD